HFMVPLFPVSVLGTSIAYINADPLFASTQRFSVKTLLPPSPLHREPRGNGSVDILTLDHEAKTYITETFDFLESLQSARHSPQQVSERMRNPLIFTYLDTEKINFERSKTASSYLLPLWGSSDKTENVSGYECKVFNANNVELVTKTRIEHLSEERKGKGPWGIPAQLSFLKERSGQVLTTSASDVPGAPTGNPYGLSEDEYLSDEERREDIGGPRNEHPCHKVQGFPLAKRGVSVVPSEQIMPIIDLLSLTNAHYAKLKDFFTLQFPSGFPLKIEIPLFHALNSRITFENIFAWNGL
ncbi:Ankyrin repeat domaincontaining protein 13Blike, partial [Caligus rogercresseyi]